jgi:uncharacterized membrane protein
MSKTELSQPDNVIYYRYSQRNFIAYCFDLFCAGAGLSFTGALITDYVYTKSSDMQWTNFSAWLLFFGMIFATAAGLFGIICLLVEKPRGLAALSWLYGLSLLVVYFLALFNNFVHSRDAWTSVVPTGLNLSVATVFAVLLAAILRASSSAFYRVKV